MAEKLYSMNEIAKRLHISKSTVYRIITGNNIDPVMTDKRTNLYSNSTLNFIKKDVSDDDSIDSKNNDSELIHELREQISDLKLERQQKNNEIKKMYELLDHQQQLSLDIQKKLPTIETTQQTKKAEPEDKSSESTQDENPRKKHWWNFFN